MTGASGGMIGAAYFAALSSGEAAQAGKLSLVEALENDITEAQRQKGILLDVPLPRDSLSDVLQQLVTWDILHIMLPSSFGSDRITPQAIGLDSDRGRTLQSHWRSIDKSFAELKAAVGRGAAPSIIFSPMIVETGQPLLISDLDLADIANLNIPDVASSNGGGPAGEPRHTLEFFRVFPRAFDRFTLQTAARMNAAFPLISPGVDLPTDPARRVVDAGYFDNYGMSTALRYLGLPEIRDWIKARGMSGAMIIQINAFPILRVYSLATSGKGSANDCDDDQPGEPVRALEWLTTPLEGLTAARERSQVYRSEQALADLRELYQKDGINLDRVAIENTSRSSFSWYLPKKDLDCMQAELKKPHNERAFEAIARIWNREARAN
jgi:hypothetical protein